MKKAFITGVTGQDGSYLAEFLLEKGYKVFGLVRPSTCDNTLKLKNILYQHNFKIFYGDVTDYNRLYELIREIKPDEIYNLAAQSHVGTSFEFPEYTFKVNAGGVMNLLNIIKKYNKDIKFYQASTSELYGLSPEIPQTESDRFYPRSPYACAKLFGYWQTVNYREAYNLFACNGILFNHESPRRGENFVTKKIVKGVVDIFTGKQSKLYLGNLYSKRDWGFAPEYVEAMWLILNYKDPEDFVIATGETHTIKEFVEEAFKHINITLIWEGEGLEEKGRDILTGRIFVEIDPSLYRPSENNILIGDYSKAKYKLNWEPEIKFKDLVRLMLQAENNCIFENYERD